jgi:hypothetical protein
LGTAAYTHHPKLYRRLILGGWQFQANPGEKNSWIPISMKKKKKAGYGVMHLSSQQLQET